MFGDRTTLLPDAIYPETGEQLHVLSCLPRQAEGWEHLAPNLWRLAREDPGDATERFEAILCASGEIPRKTGTPWQSDVPPPWEANLDWQPEDRGSTQPDKTTE